MNLHDTMKTTIQLCKSHKRYGRVGTEEDCYFQDRDKKVSKV